MVMRKLFISKKIIVLLTLSMLAVSISLGQGETPSGPATTPAAPTQNAPATPAPTQTPASTPGTTQSTPGTTQSAPGLGEGQQPGASSQAVQGRIQELRDAGVPEAQIQQILEQASAADASQADDPENEPTDEAETTDADAADTENTEEGTDQDSPPEARDEPELSAAEVAAAAQQRRTDSIRTAQNKIFGQDVFTNPQYNFRRAASQVPQAGYLIGAGDAFVVAAWGPAELSESLEVQPDGAIVRTGMGKVYVAGLTYQEARTLLIQKYRQFLPARTNIEIILGPNRRTISANLVGMVPKPGTYEIYAASTAFQALFEAGGVSGLGTVRKIMIKRNGQTIQNLDLYKFLLEGNYEPVYLQSNDYIFVPIQGKIVKIEGDIKRPMRYELLEGENLNSLLEYAGGLNYHARTNNIQIRRFVNGEIELLDIDLEDLMNRQEDFRILDGDVVNIRRSNLRNENIIGIQGAVKYPGNYQLLPGERVSDIIERAGGLDTVAFLPRAYVVRLMGPGQTSYIPIDLRKVFEEDQTHNLSLQFFDKLNIFSQLDFQEERFISISGNVRKAGRFKLSPTMTLKDLLYLAGGPRADADLNSIELSAFTYAEDLDTRQIRSDFTQEGEPGETGSNPDDAPPIDPNNPDETNANNEDVLITRVAVNGYWETDPALDTIFLSEYSQVKIYSRYDFIDQQYLQLGGAVKRPGRYQLKRGMTLKDILYLAGGLRENADVNEVELYQIIDPKDRGHYGTGTDRKEILRIQLDENWRESTIADTLDISNAYKLIVRTEGEFFQQGEIQIIGLVKKPGRYQVLPNMTLRDVLYMAGGIDLKADFENIELARIIEVEQTNGEIIPIRTLLRTISVDQDWQSDSSLDLIKLNAFDQIYVRKNPDFELQEQVTINGEIITPGLYSKKAKDERLSSLVSRAGGVTELAYLKGAYLSRARVGDVAIKLEKALRRPGSKWDIALLKGDELVIPPRMDVITVQGNVIVPGTTILYEPAKRRMKYYVNLSGGFDRKTRKKMSTVSYVDGRVKRTKSFLGIKFHPKVAQGAIVDIAAKPPKATDEKGNVIARARFSFDELVAGVSGVLTFLLLIRTTLAIQ